VFFVVYCVRENRLLLRAKPEHAIAFLMGLGLCIHFIVILCYYEGRLDRLFGLEICSADVSSDELLRCDCS